MSEQNPNGNSPEEREFVTEKLPQKKANLSMINFPSDYPIQNLMCLEEHKETFEGLFGDKHIQS